MKPILLLIVAVIVIGAAWYFLTAQNSAVPAEDTSEDTTVPVLPNTDDDEGTGTETGSDAGMEFPTIDGDVSIDPDAKVFNISGANMQFSLEEMRVQEGDTVVIHFESEGGFHDWVVDEFDARTERVRDGESTSVTFVADRKGTFEYYCSVANHRAMGMTGRLIVE